MIARSSATLTVCGAVIAALAGCQSTHRLDSPGPPPDARRERPVLKSASELAAAREERIRTGQVRIAESPEPATAASARPPIAAPPRVHGTGRTAEEERILATAGPGEDAAEVGAAPGADARRDSSSSAALETASPTVGAGPEGEVALYSATPAIEAEPRRQLTNAEIAELRARREGAVNPVLIPRALAGSIRADILLVNESVLTVNEILYPLREQIAELRSAQTEAGLREGAQRAIQDYLRQEIGSVLIFEEAFGRLAEPQKQVLDREVQHDIDRRVAREFGDSLARFEAHLAEHGLTLEQYGTMVRRRMIVAGYTREQLFPQVRFTRSDLLNYYRRNLEKFSTVASRELLLIEAPFADFLPPRVSWERATTAQQARARLQAKRHIRAAEEALATRDFRDVASEFSKGVHAPEGGSWGLIGEPLQPPYDELSQRIFQYSSGQRSEPIQTERGWYLVQCGEVNVSRVSPFMEVQTEIRTELENERFNRLAGDFIARLAERATISDMSGFVRGAVQRVVDGWPETPASR